MKKPIPGIVPAPAPVTVPEEARIDWIPAAFAIGVASMFFVVALIVGLCAARPMKPVAMTYPEAGPSDVLGQTTAPEPPPCPVCPDYSFLARFVGALDDANATPREIRDVLNRCYVESRFASGIVSSTGDYGICQINARAHPETDVERVLTDPEYAAGECLRVYRVMFEKCGEDWQCCYRYGVRGCKKHKTTARGGK